MILEGDVIKLQGREHLVVMVNDCRARCVPMSMRVEEFTAQTGVNAGKVLRFAKCPEAQNISPNSECEIIRRGGQREIDNFFAGIKAANSKGTNTSGEESNTMKTRSTKPIKSPRGGLAAEAKAAKSAAKAKTSSTPKPSKCAFIDDLLETGKFTKAEILDKVCTQFEIPKSKRDATMSTINARPSHMKAAGRKAAWKDEAKPEPKKETATAA